MSDFFVMLETQKVNLFGGVVHLNYISNFLYINFQYGTHLHTKQSLFERERIVPLLEPYPYTKD